MKIPFLARLGYWLIERFDGDTSELHVISMDERTMKLARSVVAVVGKEIENASSENKHARAFARLRRLATWATKREVSLAIELALKG